VVRFAGGKKKRRNDRNSSFVAVFSVRRLLLRKSLISGDNKQADKNISTQDTEQFVCWKKKANEAKGG